jgi:hypothetical protein
MIKLGKWATENKNPQHPGLKENLARNLAGLFCLDQLNETEADQPLPRDVWLDQIQVMAARDKAGSTHGFYLAAKGGHNAENHNHNDVGNFLVYRNGKPLMIDLGVETYIAKTFSDERYSIWTMQSDYHNLPTLNREMQMPGKQFAATEVHYRSEDDFAQLDMDISHAYSQTDRPKQWKRTLRLNRGKSVEIHDDALFSQLTEITLNFLTVCKVSSSNPGELLLEKVSLPQERTSATGVLTYNADLFPLLEIEKITLSDKKLQYMWGKSVTRIRLKTQAIFPKLFHKILITN